MKKKIALIFGVTGQDGSYLTELLLKKKYIVHGVKRRSSLINTSRVDKFFYDNKDFKLHYGDVTDAVSIFTIIKKLKPDEIYNLAAQSHVKVSFEIPLYTADVDALGSLRILEAIKLTNKKIKYYQASSSEMFGNSGKKIQDENTKFNPQSVYGVSKVFSFYVTKNYREAYNMYACNGILFNHESSRRGETFVTKKIVQGLVNIKKNKQKKLILGNLYSIRDWGHAKDFVLAMWKIMQMNKPDDYVISTNKQFSVKKFTELVAKKLDMKIIWRGKGLKEKGYVNNKETIIIDKKYFRPTDVNQLRGNFKKAKKQLKWEPKHDINFLIDEMLEGI
jgi:GDPmannose 4,6-dehydratase